MTAGIDAFFEELRREYLTEAPVRLNELRKDLSALRSGEADAVNSLKTRFHRLAGSGGSYGFPGISGLARETERWLAEHPSPDHGGLARLEDAIERIGLAFDNASRELGLPTKAGVHPPFGWQAMVIGDSSPTMDHAERLLTDAQYRTSRGSSALVPDSLPVSKRPDVAVLVAGDGSVANLVSRWTDSGLARPNSVILITGSADIDPLAVPFATLDLIVAHDRLDAELLPFVRALGQSASTPPCIVVVDPDSSRVGALDSALEGAGARVTRLANGTELRKLLQEESPDLVVTEWSLPDATAAALIRYVRGLNAFRATPIVVYTEDVSDSQVVAAIRAGADDVLLKSAPKGVVVQTLLARAERGRMLQATARRDALTGLVTHTAMVEALDAAISFARRTGESLAFAVFDLDHFRRVNERHGYVAGDQVLAGVARAIAGSIRCSDLVARLGAEEIGVLLRRCPIDHALASMEKIRRAANAVIVGEGERSVAIKLSAGIACFPEHGSTTHELLRAAERSLAGAKSAGRDRVVLG